MTPGPWQYTITKPTLWQRIMCGLFGHDISDGHPRVQDCARCPCFRYRDGDA